ncbi:MAG: hypothetical protein HW419_2358 [Deltaproteobacteria bacterium]|nr:hypothetical protein [Deltaproteobacteria bacterium]
MADAISTMLTKTQAEEMVLARLKARFDCASLAIAVQGSEERPFGWMFLLSVGETGSIDAKTAKIPRAVSITSRRNSSRFMKNCCRTTSRAVIIGVGPYRSRFLGRAGANARWRSKRKMPDSMRLEVRRISHD